MKDLKYMSHKEMKVIIRQIEEQWGCSLDDFGKKYIMIQSDEDINIITHDLAEFSFETLRINTAGMYFCNVKKGLIRLSIEGSQIIGLLATHHVEELDDEEIKLWMTGNDLEKQGEGFVIIKHKNDFMGTGRFTDDGRLLNFVPKIRRLPREAFED